MVNKTKFSLIPCLGLIKFILSCLKQAQTAPYVSVGLVETVLPGFIFWQEFHRPTFSSWIRMNGRNHQSKFALASPPEGSDWGSN